MQGLRLVIRLVPLIRVDATPDHNAASATAASRHGLTVSRRSPLHASRTTPAAVSSPDGPSGIGPPVKPSGLGRGADESSARGHQSGARARVGQPNAGVRTVGPVSPTEQRHVSASGANYGWRRSVPHATGVAVGFPIMPILVASDLERVLQVFPFVMEIFDWAGSTMMVWYAWRRATQHAARAPSLQCLVKLTARARTGAVQPDTPAPSAPARAPDAD